MFFILLNKAETISKTINIQHIADSIRDEIARLLSDLSLKQKKSQYMKKSAEILTQIEDDELRLYRLVQIGYDDIPEKNSQYAKIMVFLSALSMKRPSQVRFWHLNEWFVPLPNEEKEHFYSAGFSIFSRINVIIKTQNGC